MSKNNQTPTNDVEVKANNKVVEVKAKDVAKTKKKKEKVKKPNKVVKSLKDTGNELKKVSWTSKSDLFKSTKLVVVTVLAVCIVIALVDLGASWAINSLAKLIG